MKFIYFSTIFLVIALYSDCLHAQLGHHYHADSLCRRFVGHSLAGLVLCIGLQCPANGAVFDESDSLQNQLSILREKKRLDVVTVQKQQLENHRKDFASCKDNIIAKAVVTLSPVIASENSGSSTIDPSKYPLGLPYPTDIDLRFEDESIVGIPSLIITAVGRDGPPLAAKKFRLKDISEFPLYVELSTGDLLFPYSEDVWKNSPLRKDSISVTSILDTDGVLAATASSADSFGFAISDAIPPEGNRREAKVEVTFKSGTQPYSSSEKELLSRVDVQLAQKGFSNPYKCDNIVIK